MVRYVLVVGVAVADTALLWLDGAGGWTLAAYAVSVASVMAAADRLPFAAFLAALASAVFTGGSLALLVCTGFHAGHRLRTRAGAVVTAVVIAAYVGVVLMVAQRAPGGQEVWAVPARAVVLTVLPLLAGRYLLRQREHLRRERDLVAERERLRISRDMHDSLGHLLSLVSVRAAALEAGSLPAGREGIGRRPARARRLPQAGRPDGPRGGRPRPGRRRALQRRGRAADPHDRGHRQDLHEPRPGQARLRQPGAGGPATP